MNYKNIHDFIINRAKKRKIDGYTENHHIIPKCLGGDNAKENLVKLTAKEHYLIHRLLVRIYPENVSLIYAFWMMCNGSRKIRPVPSPKAYEEARLLFSKAMKGRISPMKGEKHSQETKEKISQSKKGQDFWTGKKHSKESRIKQSISAKNRNISIENEQLRKEKISQSKLGTSYTQEHRNNISKAKQGKNNPMFGKKWKLINGKRTYYE